MFGESTTSFRLSQKVSTTSMAPEVHCPVGYTLKIAY
jgi:hypothetical protein